MPLVNRDDAAQGEEDKVIQFDWLCGRILFSKVDPPDHGEVDLGLLIEVTDDYSVDLVVNPVRLYLPEKDALALKDWLNEHYK